VLPTPPCRRTIASLISVEMSQPLNDFLHAVSSAPALWQSFDFRIVAVHVAGAWRPVAARGILTHEASEAVVRLADLPATSTLRAWQVVRPLAEISDFLTHIEAGCLEIDGTSILFETHQFRDAPVRPWAFSMFERHLEHYVHRSLPWSSYVLRGSGDTTGELLHAVSGGWSGLDAAVQVIGRPFADLDDFIRPEFVAPGYEWRHQVQIEWMAPLAVRIDADATRFDAGLLAYRVVAESRPALEHASLVVFDDADRFGVRAASPIRINIALPVDNAVAHPLGISLAGTVEIPARGQITLSLRVGTEPIQWLKRTDYAARGESARLAAYRVSDPDLSILDSFLSPKTDKARSGFAVAVGRLLMLAGFAVDVLEGDSRLSDGVDILVHDTVCQRCFAVECTTGPLDANGKIGKLVHRVASLRSALDPVPVTGVIVSASPRAQLSVTDLQAVAADDLRVLDGDTLQELRCMVMRRDNMLAIGDFLDQCVGTVVPTDPRFI
jgi:hypothetical protein